MRGGKFLAEESPANLLLKYQCESLEDVFLKLSVLQNMGKRRRSSIAQEIVEQVSASQAIAVSQYYSNNWIDRPLDLRIKLCNSFYSPESSARHVRWRSQRNFWWIRRPFAVSGAVAAKGELRHIGSTVTTARRKSGHIDRLRKNLASAPHESIDLEELLVDVAKRWCHGVYHRAAMLANHFILLGNRPWSDRSHIGCFKSWIGQIRFRFVSKDRRLQLYVDELPILEHIGNEEKCRCGKCAANIT